MTTNNYGTNAIAISTFAKLETWQNDQNNYNYTIHIEHPEYTALCPRSGYPDMGAIIIDYIPNEKIVELKSIKLYINSFRDRKISHEDATNEIANKFCQDVDPVSLRVIGDFTRRGGIKTVVTACRGEIYKFNDYEHNVL